MNYDHIIPYSKGGSSEASNIRLLCSTCNKKRGNDFEDTHLIVRHGELYSDPLSLESEMIQDLLEICQLLLILEKQDLDEARKNLFSIIKTDDLETDIFVCSLVFKIKELLSDDEVFTVKKKLKVLKIRWRTGCSGAISVRMFAPGTGFPYRIIRKNLNRITYLKATQRKTGRNYLRNYFLRYSGNLLLKGQSLKD